MGRDLGDVGCRPITLGALTQRVNGLLKIVEGIELAIDRSEAQVGDDVQVPQERQNRLTDLVRRHVRDAGGAQLFLHLLSKDRELIVRYRPALAGFLHARDNLVAGE